MFKWLGLGSQVKGHRSHVEVIVGIVNGEERFRCGILMPRRGRKGTCLLNPKVPNLRATADDGWH